ITTGSRGPSAAPHTDAGIGSRSDRLDLLAEAGLLLLLLLAPLPFGSVQKSATFGLVAWIAALGWLVFTRRSFLSGPLAERGWALVLLGGAAVAALQICPMPRALARSLSPAAA